MPLCMDPYHDIDRQPDAYRYIESLEARGKTKSQTRRRGRFLKFVRTKPGWRVLEVGSGTGRLLTWTAFGPIIGRTEPLVCLAT